MELREYWLIFSRNLKLFLCIVAVCLLAGMLFQLYRPIGVNSSLNLNVTRQGVEETTEYRFDGYYRLQADEWFSETLVGWLKSPRIVEDVLREASVDQMEKFSSGQLKLFLNAKKMSSQFVMVEYSSTDGATANRIAEAIIKVINRETSELNIKQQEENWFIVLADQPLIRSDQFSWPWILSFSGAVGVFFGGWAVLIANYWRKNYADRG